MEPTSIQNELEINPQIDVESGRPTIDNKASETKVSNPNVDFFADKCARTVDFGSHFCVTGESFLISEINAKLDVEKVFKNDAKMIQK